MNSFFASLLGRPTAVAELPEVAALPVGTTQTTAELIAEIYRSFNSVGDQLLAEAQATLAGTDAASIAKWERLKAAGFGNTRQAKQTAEQAQKAAEAAAQQALILDYALRYPTSKFITRQHVDQIAAKYNLVVGDTSAYTGFVPDKNLREIEAFNARFQEEDKLVQQVRIKRFDVTSMYRAEIEEIKRRNPELIFPLEGGEFSLAGVPQIKMAGVGRVWVGEYELLNTSAQLICAPACDMDLSSLTQQAGHWFKAEKVHVPDPVVLQPVKGGYLIVTAWGDEASDPLVLNEQLN